MPDAKMSAFMVYSKGGHSLRAAEAIGEFTDSVVTLIDVDRYNLPVFGIVRGLYDVARKAEPTLNRELPDLSDCSWIVVGGPIWAGHFAPPVRSALAALSHQDVPVGLFSTSGDPAKADAAFAEARTILGRAFVATVDIPNAIDDTPEMYERLRAFGKDMESCEGRGVA